MWTVYLVQCVDGTLYTGITKDLRKRVEAHNSGKGAKYTRGRGPVEVVFTQLVPEKGEALKLEAAMKKMHVAQKWELIKGER